MERSTQRTVLVAVTATGFLTAFVMSGVNVALKQIASDLSLSAVAISWVTLASILATGALLMPMARVADFRGRRFVYNAGLAGFALVCFASAFAPNAAILILTRALAGCRRRVSLLHDRGHGDPVLSAGITWAGSRPAGLRGLPGTHPGSGAGWHHHREPRLAGALHRGRSAQPGEPRLAASQAARVGMARAEDGPLRHLGFGRRGCARSRP